MKFTYTTLLLIVLSASVTFAQQAVESKPNVTADWSQLFPNILGCEREIQLLTQNGKIFEQVVNYEHEGYKKDKNENYFGCGSITLRFDPSARKTARENSSISNFPSDTPIKVKGFEAYQSSPLCGNDFWEGSTAVYFDEDKVLIVSAFRGGEKILEFAQNSDYALLRKSVNKTVRRKIKQNNNK